MLLVWVSLLRAQLDHLDYPECMHAPSVQLLGTLWLCHRPSNHGFPSKNIEHVAFTNAKAILKFLKGFRILNNFCFDDMITLSGFQLDVFSPFHFHLGIFISSSFQCLLNCPRSSGYKNWCILSREWFFSGSEGNRQQFETFVTLCDPGWELSRQG